MSKMKSFFLMLATLCTLLCLGRMAHAAYIDYTVEGWGPSTYPAPTTPPSSAPHGVDGYPGDTLELQTYTGVLDLTPGTYIQKINTLLWTIDYTYGGTATDPNAWSDVSFNLSTSRPVSFAGEATGSLNQAGLLVATWSNDTLQLYSGPTISLTVQGFKVDITPLATGQFSGDKLGDQPSQDLTARFDVSPVPIPGAVWLFASGLIGLVGLRRKLKKR